MWLFLFLALCFNAFADDVKYQVNGDKVQKVVTSTSEINFDDFPRKMETLNKEIAIYQNILAERIATRDAVQTEYDATVAIKPKSDVQATNVEVTP